MRLLIAIILLFNPISLLLISILFGVGFSYSQNRPDKAVTFFTSATPHLPENSIGFDSTFERGGGINGIDRQRKSMTVYDEGGKKLLEIIPAEGKRTKEYTITSDNRFIATEKTFDDNWVYKRNEKERWVHFPDLKITLYNSDGSILIGPYENEVLYDVYTFKNGSWQRYSSSFEALLADAQVIEEAKTTSDYSFMIPNSFAGDVDPDDPQKLILAHTFEVINNTQYKQSPRSFLFTNNMYPWHLKIEYGGQLYVLNFVTIKNPEDLVFYPYRP